MKKSLRFNESDMSLEFCLARGSNARYMEKDAYDPDGDGIVDNAARLGGYLPSDFALAGSVGGVSPHIDEATGNWFIGEVDTGVHAQGDTGDTGAQGPKGDTGAQGPKGDTGAQGPKGDTGAQGEKGTDGVTPHIDPTNKHWFIGAKDTGICAEGKSGSGSGSGADGLTPFIGENGNWWIGEADTGVCASGGNSAISSTLDIDAWDSDSLNDKLYHFKLFRYPTRVDADVDVRFAVNAPVTLKNGSAYQGLFYFRYSFNLSRPYKLSTADTNATRITLKPLRIMFENEDYKDVVEYFRVYEKQGAGAENDLWVEIKTSSGSVANMEISVLTRTGDVSDVEIVQKGYDPFVVTSGYDSLTVKSADWANKTTNFNISSRAAAPYATASGNDSRAEGEAGDVGGIENVGKGRADLVRGEKNTNTGANALVTGTGNTNKGTNSVVFGSNNSNTAGHSFISGTKNTNTGSNSVMVGHTNSNAGEHVFIHGYENHNDGKDSSRLDYVDMHGTRLIPGRRLQMLRGQWNELDGHALAVWGNGSAENNRKNVFTIAASGTPIVDTDGVTFGYLQSTFKPQIVPSIGENGMWYIGDTNTYVIARGSDGANGEDGRDGYTPQKGVDYDDGYTPKKGIDYFTEEDVNEIVARVIAKLPPSGGGGTGDGGEEEHTCIYDQVVASEAHLASAATCTQAAIYYKSCTCGKNGTSVFYSGSALGHDLNENGECQREGCNYVEGAVHTHVYDQKVTTSEYLFESANCDHPAAYYYSCSCGKAGTETFEYGTALAHDFSAQNTDSQYLAESAKCLSPAEYYHSCSRCGETGTTTFVSTDYKDRALGHDYVDGVCTRCGDVQGDAVQGELIDDPLTDAFGAVSFGSLVAGTQYYLNDALFTAVDSGYGYVAPPVGTAFSVYSSDAGEYVACSVKHNEGSAQIVLSGTDTPAANVRVNIFAVLGGEGGDEILCPYCGVAYNEGRDVCDNPYCPTLWPINQAEYRLEGDDLLVTYPTVSDERYPTHYGICLGATDPRTQDCDLVVEYEETVRINLPTAISWHNGSDTVRVYPLVIINVDGEDHIVNIGDDTSGGVDYDWG